MAMPFNATHTTKYVSRKGAFHPNLPTSMMETQRASFCKKAKMRIPDLHFLYVQSCPALPILPNGYFTILSPGRIVQNLLIITLSNHQCTSRSELVFGSAEHNIPYLTPSKKLAWFTYVVYFSLFLQINVWVTTTKLYN